MHQEKIPSFRETLIRSRTPLELIDLTKDTTDYAWYITNFRLDDVDLPKRSDIHPVIQISNLGHAMHVFVNGKYIGIGHGNKIEKAFVFQRPVNLRVGRNQIAILCLIVGLPDNGPYLERRMLGLHTLTIQGLNAGTLDLSANTWGHKPKDNTIVIFEEGGGDPNGIQFNTVSRDNICTVISEFHPAGIRTWTRENNHIRTVVDDLQPNGHIKCSKGKVIKTIV
ncbi:hypothetical protein J5N97_016193 [Dioscorea zingiberensis]|uniref:Beta-galactosidase n=1 Tax=Dioscorea zingiberensis TaxID=325984 RepID=A0A9D5CKL3_9LILI|nr:hypothetical protein J5N97_016193 [Dioscorea zingiberensis]